ncbi:MAG: hypothetical protein IPH93_16060 [Saprospiraceae bacterium]|nr:hypothetical protein [Saprospiraceae bacterium]
MVNPFTMRPTMADRDMFFAGFTQNLDTFIYGTYIGGNQNDYLGDIGDPGCQSLICLWIRYLCRYHNSLQWSYPNIRWRSSSGI